MLTQDPTLTDMTVQVDDPDAGPNGMPAFDGFADHAHRTLRPGIYRANVEDTGRRVLLAVGETSSHILAELPTTAP